MAEEGKRNRRAGSEGETRTRGAGGDGRVQHRMSLLESERREDAPEDREPENVRAGRARKEAASHMRRISLAESEQKRERRENGRRESRRADAPERTQGSWQERLRMRRLSRLRRLLICLAVLLLLAYGGVAIYFGTHFYEGTEIYGIDCSQKTADEVKAEVVSRLGTYRLEIQEREGQKEYLSAEQIGLAFVDNSSIDRMLREQRSFLWPVTIFLKRQQMASVAFSYEEEKALEAFGRLNCMNPIYTVAPVDAHVVTTETGFVVESEIMGTTLNYEKSRAALLGALNAGQTVLSLEETDCYVNPQLYQDDEELNRIAAEKSELARAYITYDFGDRTETVNAPVIADWIVETANGSYVIDEVCVTEFVEALAAKYDTFGLEREFYTTIGTVETLSGGDYGWCIDQDATVVALLNALAEGYQGTMEPVYLYTGMSRSTNDIGDTYVEICISRQQMWCYQYGTCIVDTPVVTGNPNKGNATPSGGVWAIDAKKRDAILVGEGYSAPVDYWMPFNGDVGIHDMQARAWFGSTIYLTNGSHGCVNTPYEAARTIFETVSIGTPVIVYE